MNISAIDTATTALAQSATHVRVPARPAQAAATPAATVTITSVPATVKPADRALYLQILKSVHGNVNVALAALAVEDAKVTKG